MGGLTDRPTPDLVLLILTVLIAVVVILTGAGIFALALAQPDADLARAFEALASLLALIIGTVIGYLAGKGRSAGSREE